MRLSHATEKASKGSSGQGDISALITRRCGRLEDHREALIRNVVMTTQEGRQLAGLTGSHPQRQCSKALFWKGRAGGIRNGNEGFLHC